MPTIITIKNLKARDIPADHNQLQETKVQIKFADLDTQQSKPQRNDSKPEWTDEVFNFELPEDRLFQDEPMRLEVLDSNLGADEIIGKVLSLGVHRGRWPASVLLQVYLDLTCLCVDLGSSEKIKNSDKSGRLVMGPKKIEGWFPIYDTLKGCCGELHVAVS